MTPEDVIVLEQMIGKHTVAGVLDTLVAICDHKSDLVKQADRSLAAKWAVLAKHISRVAHIARFGKL